ncbi:Ycf66-like protein [Hyella patelloides LEGE 07179]|uniref:Ycf66-like protein n=1 Tax=Hyella patelloides LEGE 07179 TaxID=945734 RepID=A0A563VXA1_9CYAN|nr:Ycf66 family protein [Hyella patelloides]VEP16041.1 Ycf66-like protein [Hyella patelloides LEGE 07179]
MVNFGLNSASILGIFLAVAGASLYFLRSVRPELSRDHDIFFAAVGLLCGFILLFQGWRLDPILQFGQFLLTGSTIFFAVESIRLRKVATEQARRNTPTVDRDRPVSRTRVYREEEFENEKGRSIPDAYNAYEGAAPNYDSPRLRGYDDPQPRPSRSRSLREEEPRSRNSRSRGDRSGAVEPTRSRRPRNTPPRRDSRDSYGEWSKQDSWDEPDYPDTRRSRSKRDRFSEEPRFFEDKPRPSTRRPAPNSEARDRSYSNDDLGRSYNDSLGRSYEDDLGDSYEEDTDVIATDYVDYQPIDDLGSDDDDDDDYGDNEQDSSETRQPPSDWDEPRRRNTRPEIDY